VEDAIQHISLWMMALRKNQPVEGGRIVEPRHAILPIRMESWPEPRLFRKDDISGALHALGSRSRIPEDDKAVQLHSGITAPLGDFPESVLRDGLAEGMFPTITLEYSYLGTDPYTARLSHPLDQCLIEAFQ
jgi:hypothetical protein